MKAERRILLVGAMAGGLVALATTLGAVVGFCLAWIANLLLVSH